MTILQHEGVCCCFSWKCSGSRSLRDKRGARGAEKLRKSSLKLINDLFSVWRMTEKCLLQTRGSPLAFSCVQFPGPVRPSLLLAPQLCPSSTVWKEYINVQIDGFIFFGNVSCVEVQL